VFVADVRWALGGPPGAEAFAVGHLPGAVYVDLETQLAAAPSATEGRHPLPTPEQFADAMSSLGVGDDTTVVAYDDVGGSSAARLVWLLRILGVDAALLDGGLRAWTAPAETGPSTPARASFTARPWPVERFVDADELMPLAAAGTPVLDARDEGRFTGERPAPVDARPGHVPGASSAPWQQNLDASGRFLDADALAAAYASLGVADDTAPVVYCGSGVTACHDLLALERAGVDGARIYAPGWSSWAATDDRAVETGPR